MNSNSSQVKQSTVGAFPLLARGAEFEGVADVVGALRHGSLCAVCEAARGAKLNLIVVAIEERFQKRSQGKAFQIITKEECAPQDDPGALDAVDADAVHGAEIFEDPVVALAHNLRVTARDEALVRTREHSGRGEDHEDSKRENVKGENSRPIVNLALVWGERILDKSPKNTQEAKEEAHTSTASAARPKTVGLACERAISAGSDTLFVDFRTRCAAG